MSTLSRLGLGLRSTVVLSMVALAACATSTDEAEDDFGEVVDIADAITDEERALGEAFPGAHDDLSDEEEAALSKDVDDTNDPGPSADDDLSTQSLRPLAGSGCTNTTGYDKGRARKICVTSVQGKQVEINTAKAYVRMRDAAKRDGVTLLVVSGFRTMTKQRELYALYKKGRGNLAAPPGYSNHQSGLALDLNARAPGVYTWLSRNAGKFGFVRTVPSENWHWEKRR